MLPQPIDRALKRSIGRKAPRLNEAATVRYLAPMLIGIAGMVGSGKSTLTRALAARFGLQHAMESVDDENPWLEPFYGGGVEAMREYALPLQLHFLATRFASMRRMRGAGGSWILDRTWYEDAEIFARGHHEEGLLSDPEWELYQRLYVELLHSPAARPPRLLVYLHAPLDVIVARIRVRGRPSERETPESYWAALHARYDRWISSFRACPVLALDVRDYDLVGDPSTIDPIAARVRAVIEPVLPQTELELDGGRSEGRNVGMSDGQTVRNSSDLLTS